MSKVYNPYECSAIVSVREHKNYSIVDKEAFDDKKEPIYNPRLILINPEVVKPGSLQQPYTTNTYNYCRDASLFGGSTIDRSYSSSYDAYTDYRCKGKKDNADSQ